MAQHQEIDDGLPPLPSVSLRANAKRRLAGSIAIKPNFFAFSLLWLCRPTRPATLLSSLDVINEHVLHVGRAAEIDVRPLHHGNLLCRKSKSQSEPVATDCRLLFQSLFYSLFRFPELPTHTILEITKTLSVLKSLSFKKHKINNTNSLLSFYFVPSQSTNTTGLI